MLCVLSGLNTSCRLVESIRGYTKSSYYAVNIYASPKYTIKGDCIDMHGGIMKGENTGKESNPNTATQKYKGVVWCPVTNYGTFVCRRNNKIYITGNSYKDEMVGDAKLKMYSALKLKKYDIKSEYNPFSYFTTIAFNAFINRIKKEKKHHEAVEKYKGKVYEEYLNASEDMSHYIYTKPDEEETYSCGEEEFYDIDPLDNLNE